MMVAEQIQLPDQFPVDKSKPLQSGFVGTMMLIINFLLNSGFDPEFVEHLHIHERVTSVANNLSRALQSKYDSLLASDPARFETKVNNYMNYH